jgi:hypothetical protein
MFKLARPVIIPVLSMIFLSTAAAEAGNLRGMVAGVVRNGVAQSRVGRAGVPISLAVNAPGAPVTVARTISSNGGYYFFLNIRPGNYLLVVGNLRYPVTVLSTPNQDIPPIFLP